MGRYGLGLVVGVAALVGLRLWLGSMDQEIEHPHPRVILTWMLFLMAATSASLVLRSWPGFSAGRVGLLALVVLELYIAREPMEYNRPVDPSLYTAAPPFAELLDDDRSSRMLSLANDEYELPDRAALLAGLPPFTTEAEAESYLYHTRLKRMWPADVGMVFGVNSLDGSDGGMLPTWRWAELKRALMGLKGYNPDLAMRSEGGRIPSSGTLGAFGVRYLLLDEGRSGQDPGWVAVEGTGGVPLRLLRNSALLPRARVVHEAQFFTSEQGLLEALPGLDLGRTVALSEEVEYQAPAEPGRDAVVLARDSPNEVVVEVSAEQPGFLVLSDSYYPGWKAYLDGQEVPLLRADYAVRAVQLAAGSHEVRFVFDPLSIKLGLAASVLGLLVVGLLLVRRRGVKPRERGERELWEANGRGGAPCALPGGLGGGAGRIPPSRREPFSVPADWSRTRPDQNGLARLPVTRVSLQRG